MGSIFGKKTTKKVFINGLDASGKTTCLYKLANSNKIPAPTCGFIAEDYETDRCVMSIWEVGGGFKIREGFRKYYYDGIGYDGMVYIVDSSDQCRMGGTDDGIVNSAKNDLEFVLTHDSVKHCPWLILANKQDCSNTLSVEEITKIMDLGTLLEGKTWKIQGCSSLTGKGLKEAFAWLESVM
eukprot:TRINITY_DN68987_c0_g1_i1.p1 TRINITY_DN68987_c0_g1~~TRINITY_DN68987_c0_g1_i1.p1  ORF type:complete len:182 (-),score=37.51 TRINITY_DN68987_c0_g1_i1:140-685(-)